MHATIKSKRIARQFQLGFIDLLSVGCSPASDGKDERMGGEGDP